MQTKQLRHHIKQNQPIIAVVLTLILLRFIPQYSTIIVTILFIYVATGFIMLTIAQTKAANKLKTCLQCSKRVPDIIHFKTINQDLCSNNCETQYFLTHVQRRL